MGEYLFPGLQPGKPLSNMAMLRLLKAVNRDDDGKPRWVDPRTGRPIAPHGLRANFRTWGEDKGLPGELLEEALGHKFETTVERAYRRTDAFERRRVVMQNWADYLESAAGQPLEDKVLVTMRVDGRALPFGGSDEE